MKPDGQLITLQDLAGTSGLSLSSLNYYVSLGLLPVEDRRGNKRFFVKSTATRHLERIQKLKREGYPLRIIRHELHKEGLIT
jgi:DNA-binding transcriptional MerR regulator